eukprot:Clim_evm10s204 gene=Clim_evmTU10s204
MVSKNTFEALFDRKMAIMVGFFVAIGLIVLWALAWLRAMVSPSARRKSSTAVRLFPVALAVFLGILAFALPPRMESMINRVTSVEDSHIPSSISPKALDLHRKLIVSDLHADSLLWARDLNERAKQGHVDVPRMIEGNMGIQSFTIVSKVPVGLNFVSNSNSTLDQIGFVHAPAVVRGEAPVATLWSPFARAMFQCQSLHKFADRSNGKLRVLKSRQDLQDYVTKRRNDLENGVAVDYTAGFLGIEGTMALEGKLSNLQKLYDEGLRMVALAHFIDTEFAGSAQGEEHYGLTPLGKKLVRECERLGIILDVSHASHEAVKDTLAIATKPVLNSHTGVDKLAPSPRNTLDEEFIGVARTGGVTAISFFPETMGGKDIKLLINQIKYCVDLVGADHCALGSDYDGAVPVPFDVSKLAIITDLLLQKGLNEEQIRMVMGEAVVRTLEKAWPLQ